MIEVKNLTKRYGNHLAVENVSFNVEKGEILGLLGPNGAGKSTIMNIITGYISTTEGSVKVNGVDIYEEPEEVKKMIGYLPELPPLYLDMTVKEYLNFAADIKKIKRDEKKQMIEDIMELTKIAPMANRLINQLSKGYRQRVGLAQAILGYPEVIILDEPTVGLDPKQITEIRELISNLSKEHTVILSSHIMQEVSAVCDSVMIINKGKLILRDKADKLSNHFAATGAINISVKGDKNIILNVLNDIDQVNNVEEKEHFVKGVYNLTVHCDDDVDIREDVFNAMARAKTPILEMQSVKMSLEDIFLKVTEENNPVEISEDIEEVETGASRI